MNFRGKLPGPSQYAIVPKIISNALGFRRRIFSNGTTHGENIIDKGALNQFTAKEKYTIKVVNFRDEVNVIKMNRVYTESYTVQYRGQSTNQFLQNVCDAVNVSPEDFKLDLSIVESGNVRVTVETKDEQDQISFPDSIREVFGFTSQKVFKAGTFDSETDFDEDRLKSQPVYTRFIIEIFRLVEIPIPMHQVTDESYVSVLAGINSAFAECDFDEVRPEFLLVDGNIKATQIPDDVSITLPDAINSYFGLEGNATFTSTSSFGVKISLYKQEQIVETAERVLQIKDQFPSVKGELKDLLVQLDVIPNQVFGKRNAPILQTVQWDLKSDVVFTPKSVIYLPLLCKHLNSIRVSITNKELRELRHIKFAAILRLHLKPRLY